MLVRVAVLLLLGSVVALAKPPELDEPVPGDAESILVPGSSGKMLPGYRIVRDGTPYILGANNQQKIVFIQPGDAAFKTPEGVAVGANFLAVFNISHQPLVMRPGWGYYLRLPSGWNAAFVASPQDPTGTLHGNERISFLFKSDWAK